jgi:hypothetical protein
MNVEDYQESMKEVWMHCEEIINKLSIEKQERIELIIEKLT